jgi:HK97 family phage major capsid protein
MATRLGRILNTKFTVGAGTTEPNGIVTAAVANNGAAQVWGTGSGPGIPVIAAGSSSNTGGSETGGTTIGYADWVNLEHSVDPLYRKNAMWMMHDTTLRQAKTLLDKYGRPIWVPGMTAGAPDTILTYRYSINNDVDQIAVNNKTVFFGALDKYLIRRVKELGIMRLNERFADYGQVAFIGFARYDGNLIDAGTHPVNYLKQAAS